jgi:transcriptional regulator with XRE-family HTH domain
MFRKRDKDENVGDTRNQVAEDAFGEAWFSFLHQTFSRLKTRFAERGISQDELAARLDCDKAFVSRALRGQGNVTLRTMFKIARALEYRMEIGFVDLRNVPRVNRKHIEQRPLVFHGKGLAITGAPAGQTFKLQILTGHAT